MQLPVALSLATQHLAKGEETIYGYTYAVVPYRAPPDCLQNEEESIYGRSVLRQILFDCRLNPIGETRVLHQPSIAEFGTRAVHVILEPVH